MSSVIPQGSSERISWALNFEKQFPGLAAEFGFTAAEQASLLADSAAMRFAIVNAQAGAAFSKACTAYKNDLLGGVGENQATPAVPSFTATPAPPASVDAGVIERLSKAMNTVKLKPAYTPTVGETLQIATPPTDSAFSPDAKPSANATAMTATTAAPNARPINT